LTEKRRRKLPERGEEKAKYLLHTKHNTTQGIKEKSWLGQRKR